MQVSACSRSPGGVAYCEDDPLLTAVVAGQPAFERPIAAAIVSSGATPRGSAREPQADLESVTG